MSMSIKKLNKFALEGFSFAEAHGGLIVVKHEKLTSSGIEGVSTGLNLEAIEAGLKPLYNFTHVEVGGKLIDKPLEVLGLRASNDEINKSIDKFMQSRVPACSVNTNSQWGGGGGNKIEVRDQEDFDKRLEKDMTNFDQYCDACASDMKGNDDYSKLSKRKKELRDNPPQKTFLGIGYKKQHESWNNEIKSIEEDLKVADKGITDTRKKKTEAYSAFDSEVYGSLFHQILLQAAVGVAREDVEKRYEELAAGKNAMEKSMRQHEVDRKLQDLGVRIGHKSGVVEADKKASVKIKAEAQKNGGSEYDVSERQDRGR